MSFENSNQLFSGGFSLQQHALAIYAALITLAITLIHYCFTLSQFSKQKQNKSTHKTPPLVPYFLPFLGNIPWKFLWNPIALFSDSSYFSRAGHPVQVKILTKELYIVQGSRNVLSLLGHTSTSNTVFNSSFLQNACGMSQQAVTRFESNSEAPPCYHNRKNYLDAAPLYSWSSTAIHDYLAGRSVLQLSKRFETYLKNRLHKRHASITGDGLLMADFIDLFAEDVVPAMIDSMCGTGFIERNRAFPQGFWVFCDNLPTFMKGTPRLFAKKTYKARDEALSAVKDWQAWASENFDASTTPLNEDGDDPFWGSRFFRERYSTLVYELGFDTADVASLELGFLFGASSNVTLNTYWCVIEAFKDKRLLQDIRQEVSLCKMRGDGVLEFDVNRLLQQPILQAVFAENLRLRCHNMYIRRTTDNIQIQDWLIPRNKFAIAWTTPGHTDPSIWCNSSCAQPVDVFWPGRFLQSTDQGESLRFSLAGTEGSWLPFGSGSNLCPGNHLAKIHCLLTIAMMTECFDCDILASPDDLKLDLSKFGVGVLSSSGKIQARLRPRELQN